jgi:hypothetical protein
LKEKGTCDVVKGADDTFGFTVLLRGVGAGETEVDAVASEVGHDGGVKELSTVVSLHGDEREVELGACISNEIKNSVGGVRFFAKGKRPHIVRVVVDNDKIVFKARIAKNRRGP